MWKIRQTTFNKGKCKRMFSKGFRVGFRKVREDALSKKSRMKSEEKTKPVQGKVEERRTKRSFCGSEKPWLVRIMRKPV